MDCILTFFPANALDTPWVREYLLWKVRPTSLNAPVHTPIRHVAAPQTHRACNNPGRPFCDKACNRIGGLATNPPLDKPIGPIQGYSTLHRGLRRGFVTEGPRQRYVAEGGGGDRDKPTFRVTAIWLAFINGESLL